MNGSKIKHTYLLVLEIQPMDIGSVNNHSLHTTIADWFETGLEPQEITKLAEPVFSSTEPFEIKSKSLEYYGENRDVAVYELFKNVVIEKLHNFLIESLKASGVEFIHPQYIGPNYHPHVTISSTGKFETGSTHTVTAAYLIENIGQGLKSGNKHVLARIELKKK